MELDIKSLIGEATAYDKKLMLEVRRSKSWLKSVSAFANGEGGLLIFGISDEDQIIGLADAEGDAEKISEEIKSKLDPVPAVKLELKEADGKKLVLLHVYPGQETPYFDTLVAHNATFDRSCLEHSAQLYNLHLPELQWQCTLKIARQIYNFGCNTLGYLCEQLGIPEGTHHRAGDDAEMCARLYLREMENLLE